ncbi:shikimate dehydrogenase [Blattabacterium sp. (Blattella germanica) str. Bge]|uniref:shikimate dehydrogenase family protein n=1 Tax=Blattabacterium sp. (Blattella germanica) TaxID=624186 RepID=UPI0001BB60E2|nr:shikimate dehydrogenase [Blattabacterium sp. (Blattella germanica)]ACY40172.1 shikimate dehydrogenase [Blattabacterium sp. (Blattella germanica) str. Bge]
MNNYKFLFGLIGKGINYSFSRKFFLEKFKRESILHTDYKIFDIPNIKDVSLIFQDPCLKGCNVTIPYKTSIIPFLTKIVPEAETIGSVNVVKIDKNGVDRIGYNTDIVGFEFSFKKDLKRLPFVKNLKALILGTGGVSKTISFVLNKLQIPYQYVSRTKKKGFLVYEDINENLLKQYKIIINCTPLGTFPNVNLCPSLPYQYISSEHYFYDLVYNPNKSLFLKEAEKKGALIKNGLEMLYLQAEESWKIWNSD